MSEKNNAQEMLDKLSYSKKNIFETASADKIKSIFDDAGVAWQIGEMGKVDEGGGGTVAQYIANLNVEVIDCGVPLLSMHSPFELASKADIFAAYKGYKAFFEKI